MKPVRVVKVGGSLFHWPLLPRALTNWLEVQPPAANVLIAGGGALADAIRQADASFHLGDERSHARCLEVMGVTARMLAELLKDRAPLVSDLGSIVSAPSSTSWFTLDVRRFMLQQEPQLQGERLPHTWDATSDSIAARVAVALTADELVLLKSCDPPGDYSCAQLAASGIIDQCFPKVAEDFRGAIRLVNLRAMAPALRTAR
jgi:aspartokinase-like uncharacterized kinase